MTAVRCEVDNLLYFAWPTLFLLKMPRLEPAFVFEIFCAMHFAHRDHDHTRGQLGFESWIYRGFDARVRECAHAHTQVNLKNWTDVSKLPAVGHSFGAAPNEAVNAAAADVRTACKSFQIIKSMSQFIVADHSKSLSMQLTIRRHFSVFSLSKQ